MAKATELTKRLGVSLDPETLRLALTHRSWAYEHDGEHNERLEFLGDSVLGFCVTTFIFDQYPSVAESQMTALRARLVSTQTLAHVARNLGVGAHIRLGKGEQQSNGQDKDSILADTMEALLGAVYLTHGLDAVKSIIAENVLPLIDDEETIRRSTDWKTLIRQIAGQHDLGEVVYDVTGEGPDHAHTYTARLLIGEKRYGQGTATSKKDAEKLAAGASWKMLVGDLMAMGVIDEDPLSPGHKTSN